MASTESSAPVGEPVAVQAEAVVIQAQPEVPQGDFRAYAGDAIVLNKWEKCLAGDYTGGPCCPCWSFFLLGWFFTIVFIRQLVQEGSDIFTFDEPAVKTDIKVQEYYALSSAVRSGVEGCTDEYHSQSNETCESMEECEWNAKREKCNYKDPCPSPPPKKREDSLFLDFMPAWVVFIYEGLNGRSILDDDMLALIDKYEKKMLTDVGGAKNKETGLESAWNEDWCLMRYPMMGDGEGKCAPGFSPLNLFQQNAHGREMTKVQALGGFSYVGPLSCICTDDPGLCHVCNEDGTVKGAGLANPLLGWDSEVQNCITDWLITAQSSAPAASPSPPAPAECQQGGGMGGGGTMEQQMAQLGAFVQMVEQMCSAKQDCQWSPPLIGLCSSNAFFGATDADGLVEGEEKQRVLDKICDVEEAAWYNIRASVLPLSYDCNNDKGYSRYGRAFYYAGANSGEDADASEEEGKNFTNNYVQGRGGWYQNARVIEAEIEAESGGDLRIMIFSGATIIAQYLEILQIDGFLSIGSLILVWMYMWFTLESLFLASCGMFEIVFSLPVGMFLWNIILQQKIFWYQMLVIYMILGIGADDVFILMDAWLQSAYEPPEISGSPRTRFGWAYRRSFHAMLVTTATTCGSFVIGAASPLPQVQSFCVFAAVVVFVDWLFCVSFFASAVLVFEKYLKGKVCGCCGNASAPGKCCGPGCCFGGVRAMLSCCGTKWSSYVPRPRGPHEPPEPRAMEKFFSGPAFNFYKKRAVPLMVFWAVVVAGMAVSAGLQLRTAKKRSPIGRENIDVIRGFEVLLDEFTFRGNPNVHIAFGIDEADPVSDWGASNEQVEARFGGNSASNLKKPEQQMELLALCRAPDLGDDDDSTRCSDRTCTTFGTPAVKSCKGDVDAWRKFGYFLKSDMMCQDARYCFMEEIAHFWAYKEGDCPAKNQLACTASPCAWDAERSKCYSTLSADDYPGLPEDEFMSLIKGDSGFEFDEYIKNKVKYLRAVGRSYDANNYNANTGLRLNGDRTDIQFAFIGYNASFPRENTVDQANAWYDRWNAFKERHGPNLGGFQTAELYLYLVTQNEMVKAATMGICLSLLVSFVILVITTRNVWAGSLGLVTIVAITATFLGIVPLMGWSLGENECIFMIATVGLSVDYTVHLLNAYNSVNAYGREDRAQGALAEMGISVANSAITTLLAALILFGCGFFFFFQFGGFIFMVIGLSIFMSLNLLMPMLIKFGPQGNQGRFLTKKQDWSTLPNQPTGAPPAESKAIQKE